MTFFRAPLIAAVLVLSGVVLPHPAWAVPKTYYIRNGGSTTTNCTGLTNADYPGSGTGQACAYSNLQDAIDATTWGDTIKLHAGQTFDLVNPFDNFTLRAKGTPPTGTDADYITITTDDTTSTPSALSGYPATQTRIQSTTPGTASTYGGNMPRLRACGTEVFVLVPQAKYWIIERLNITNGSPGCPYQIPSLISTQTDRYAAISDAPDRIIIRLNWIHPAEDDGSAFAGLKTTVTACNVNGLSCTFGSVTGLQIGHTIYLTHVGCCVYTRTVSGIAGSVVSWTGALGETLPDGSTVTDCDYGTYCKSANHAMSLDTTNTTIEKNACQGFAGITRYGSLAGQNLTDAACLLSGLYTDAFVLQNNYLESYTYSWFTGGTGYEGNFWVTDMRTVTNCVGKPSTRCDFSSVSGLAVGKAIAVYTTNNIPFTGASRDKYGSAFVQCIGSGCGGGAGSTTVVFDRALCHGYTGGNSCTDMQSRVQVTHCTSASSCTFAVTTGLAIGDSLTMCTGGLNGDGGCVTPDTRTVSNITGTGPFTVTVSSAFTATPADGTWAQWNSAAPSNGDNVRLSGVQVQNVTVKQNNFVAQAVWGDVIGSVCGKGNYEIKNCKNCLITGNTFEGCGAGTLTTRNQNMDSPWVTASGTTFTSNFWKSTNPTWDFALCDAVPIDKSSNVTYSNNLYTGLTVYSYYQAPAAQGGNLSINSTRCADVVTFSHNDVLYSKTSPWALSTPPLNYRRGFTGQGGDPTATVTNVVIRDNFLGAAPHNCVGGATGLLADCMPSASIDHNVLINTDSWPLTIASEGSCPLGLAVCSVERNWTTPYPSNTVESSIANIQFTSAPSGLDATGNYRLLSSSPYRAGGAHQASDGTDVGVNYTTLINALGFDPNGTTWTEQLTIGIR